MRAQSDTSKVHAFVDGELDLASQLEMEGRLQDELPLREQVEQTRQLREMLRESADYHTAPPEFRARMEALRAPQPPKVREPSSTANGFFQRWLGWRPLSASMGFALVLAIAVNLAWLQSSREERLTEDIVTSHVRSTLGQHLVDVASSDHHTVKPFLSSKLDFSPPVDELSLPGSTFLGGRVDYVDGRPVAALVYRQGEHIVSSYIWPGNGSSSNPGFSAERGYQIAHWSRDGMVHWVISDVNRTEFQSIVEAIRAAGTER